MKLLLVFVLIVLLAGAVVGELIVQDPGYVLLSYQTTTIETSIWGLGMVVLVSFTTLYVVLQLLQYLKRLLQLLLYHLRYQLQL